MSGINSDLLIIGIIPLIGLLKKSVVPLGNPGPGGVDLSYRRARYAPVFISTHF